MRAVWKFPFEIKDRVVLEMPEEAVVLLVECQDPTPGFGGKVPIIWAEINTNNEFEERTFFVYGTGMQIPWTLKHVASFQHGQFVWHLYQ